MKVRLSVYKLIFLVLSGFATVSVRAQFLVDMIDTASSQEKGLWAIYRKADHLQISGYFQPQFQAAQSKGVENFSGGDFSKFSNNRFFMRRGRIRFDYAHFNDRGLPQAQVVFQFDGTERGVFIRDFWGRIYESRWQLFSFTTGMFARPFGYEVNLSSGDRETPERGRMSQILMRTERDLGVMASFEPRKRSSPFRRLKLDVGIFNGQGLAGPDEFDSYKDLITRLSLKPYPVSNTVSVSAGASLLEGGLANNSKYVYKMSEPDGGKNFRVDSSESNLGAKVPRKYRGVDGQIRVKHGWGKTELRTEYWWGTQTGTARESTTPGTLLEEPHYVRNFNGAFVYLVQNIVSEEHEVVFKYDYYDPNKFVNGKEIGSLTSNTSPGDVKFHTFGAGYLYYLNNHIKFILWYDMIRNESTSLNGYTSDIRDNIFTFRVQYRF